MTMADPSELAPDLEPTLLGGPPPPFTDSSANMAARFAVLRDRPSDDHERADRPHPEADATRYEFGETFARGGLGRIRRAYDRRLQRFVAVKELQDPSRGGSAEARFMREALITARLEHPSIIPIHDVGAHDDGEPFYCMKLVEGRSLEEIVRATPMLAERLALLPHALAVADALAYAHDRQVVHRDLKPSNVLVGPFGETVVIDWGLAKDLRDPAEAKLEPRAEHTLKGDGGRELTQTGELLGTLPFMPLEQAEGHDVGPPADVYAAGALLYFLLSGRPPYDGRNAAAIYHQLLATPPPDIHQLVPDISPDLAAIVRRAMARAPTDRYDSARELAADLRRFLAGRMVAARVYSAMDVLRYFVARHRTLLGIVGTSLVLLLALGIFSYVRISRENAEAERQRTRAADNLTLAEHNRAEAEQEAQRAKDSAFTALLASGRHLLFDQHEPQKALPILNDAYKLASGDRRIKRLLGEATIAADSLLHDFALPAAVSKLRFDPTGERLLAVDGDGNVHMWRVADGTPEPIFSIHGAKILEADFAGRGLFVRVSGELLYYEDGTRRWSHVGPEVDKPFAAIVRPQFILALEATGIREFNIHSGAVDARWRPAHPFYFIEPVSARVEDEIFMFAHRVDKAMGQYIPVTVLQWDSQRHDVSEIADVRKHNKHSIVVDHSGRHLSLIDDGLDESGDPHDDHHALVRMSAPHVRKNLDRCEHAEINKLWGEDAVFSADDKYIVRLINNHQIVRWSTETGRCERKTSLLSDAFDTLRASRDTRTIVAVGRNSTIAVLDGDSLALRRQFVSSATLITDVALHPDANRLAVGDADGHVRIWSLQDPRISPAYPIEGRPVGRHTPMLMRQDGGDVILEQFELNRDGTPPTHEVRDRITAQELESYVTRSTKDFLIAADAQGKATIWSLPEATRRCTRIPLRAQPSWGDSVTSDANSIIIVENNLRPGAPHDAPSRIETVDVQNCRSHSLVVGPGINSAHGTPSLSRALTVGFSRTSSRLIDTTTGEVLAQPEVGEEFWEFATPFPDGRRIVVGDSRGGIRVLDMQTGALIVQLKRATSVRIVATTGRAAAFFAPSGDTFITASPDGPLEVWDSETWTRRGRLVGHTGSIESVLFSDDSTRAVSFSSDGFGDANVFLWDLDTEEGLRLDVAEVSTVAFDARLTTVATGTQSGTIHLWDAATGEQVDRLEGDTSDVWRLVFSEDGRSLLSSSWERSIIWKLPFETRSSAELDALIAARDLSADR
jgi:WD40 repeat protein